ncbi:uncharacterized protein LOC141697555 isoform X2 [Apium graveolens]|uniref:uncharacterized protein LOC141697555 isoform X2 n=1 Tax=Apium graveolens TaxID=4045 RepID=UPI003D78FD2A
MEMDEDIGRWILDFFVRQPIDDSTLSSLLSTLPLSDSDSKLKKLLLLRNIDSLISTPTLDLLCLLEQIEELHHRENLNTVQSIKRAYCAVAVHCTLKFLQDDEVECFQKAVKDIWIVRVGGMLKFGDVGLLSDELLSWKEDIVAALRDCSVRKVLLDKWKCGVGVVQAVRGFVEEAKEVIGPSFLEVVTQDDAIVNLLFGSEETEQGDTLAQGQGILTEQGEKGDTLAQNDGTLTEQGQKGDTLARDDGTLSEQGEKGDTLAQDDGTLTEQGQKDVQEGTVHRRSKIRAAKQHKRLTPRTSRGVKIVDNDEQSDASPHNNYGFLSSPEVTKLQENLRSSSLELQGMVKDPLPEALEVAKNVVSKMGTVDKRTDVIPAENSNLGNEGSTHQKNATKPSLMERNKTARTYEWDESIDGSADLGTRPHLSSPKKRLVTPLKKHDPILLRRKRRFWSNLEEDTLREGVHKYGLGNWKLILNMYRDIFDERTEVDLKDKWRNMTT